MKPVQAFVKPVEVSVLFPESQFAKILNIYLRIVEQTPSTVRSTGKAEDSSSVMDQSTTLDRIVKTCRRYI
ncbi:MAG: hypothetical protein QXU87_06355 [Candidatus Caldarchaeum sp.]|uniref:Uncharacterized protein n=1 Tax=Caldiarchaeum subterraneum TaxID=311458 RepID=A0A7C5LB73_CALS0